MIAAGADRGSVSLVSVGLVTVIGTLAVAVAAVGGWALADERAQGAADAVALAAAYDARDIRALGARVDRLGAADGPCAVGRQVAREWGVRITACVVDARGRVFVEVREATALGVVSRSSRAGVG